MIGVAVGVLVGAGETVTSGGVGVDVGDNFGSWTSSRMGAVDVPQASTAWTSISYL